MGRFRLITTGLFVWIALAGTAAADIITTVNLDDVTFTDGGTATGSVVIDLTATPLGPSFLGLSDISADVTTTGGTNLPGTVYDEPGGFSAVIDGTDTPEGFIYVEGAYVLQLESVDAGVLSILQLSFLEPTSMLELISTTTASPLPTAPNPLGPNAGNQTRPAIGCLHLVASILFRQ